MDVRGRIADEAQYDRERAERYERREGFDQPPSGIRRDRPGAPAYELEPASTAENTCQASSAFAVRLSRM